MAKQHKGLLMPDVKDRQFAYEDEYVMHPAAVITAYHNRRCGVKQMNDEELAERETYDRYELTIRRHTGSALEITLRKKRTDVVQQRKAGGKVVTHDVYQRGISFANLVNLLFSDCEHYEDCEAYPDSIHEAMKTAYDASPKTPGKGELSSII